MKTIAIIDYGLGNLDSVVRAVRQCGGHPQVTAQAEDITLASAIILPGVGSFRDGMAALEERGLDQPLRHATGDLHVPFLGICLGMQLMADQGIEGCGDGKPLPGLGIIPGRVQRLEPDGPRTRIPHIGWNEVNFVRPTPLSSNIANAKDFYFVHSYHLVPRDHEDVLAHTNYCGGFVSVAARGSTYGVQFHPEKSQKIGFQLLRNFLAL